jgi:hypothetical protein
LNQRFALILTVGLLTAGVGVWTATQWQGKTVNGDTWILQGTLRFLDLEGGCWMLENDTGKRFQLVGLPPSLLQNGVRLRLEVKKAERMMGKCQTGEFVRVLRVLQVQRPKTQLSRTKIDGEISLISPVGEVGRMWYNRLKSLFDPAKAVHKYYIDRIWRMARKNR